jgi:hypothetical protein
MAITMNELSYFLALWQDCQNSIIGVFDCNNCIVPLNLCKKWLEEPEAE